MGESIRLAFAVLLQAGFVPGPACARGAPEPSVPPITPTVIGIIG